MVYGTGTLNNSRRFSRQCTWDHCNHLADHTTDCVSDLVEQRICLPLRPTRFNDHPSGRGPYVTASRLELTSLGGTGILNPFAIAYAFRPRLRTRLTLFRLTLNRNPWAYGGRVFHPSYRYSCLHFRFHPLHRASRLGFYAEWNAPLPLFLVRSFGAMLNARYIFDAGPLDQ